MTVLSYPSTEVWTETNCTHVRVRMRVRVWVVSTAPASPQTTLPTKRRDTSSWFPRKTPLAGLPGSLAVCSRGKYLLQGGCKGLPPCLAARRLLLLDFVQPVVCLPPRPPPFPPLASHVRRHGQL